MSELLRVTIPGEPVGAARPRFRRSTGTTYKVKTHAIWEAIATDVIRSVWDSLYSGCRLPREPLDEPVMVEVTAYHSRPARLRRRKHPRCRMPATRKPDLDNVIKLVLDAMVKARVLRDDTIVVHLVGRRWYLPIDASGADIGVPCVQVVLGMAVVD